MNFSTTGKPRVAMVVPDLFFATRISETARRMAVDLVPLTMDRALAVCAGERPVALIVDLEAPGDPFGLIRSIKTGAATGSIRVVAFYPHVHNALRLSAIAAGADAVLPRSAFSARLAELLSELGGSTS